MFREGFQKRQIIHILWIRGGGGPRMEIGDFFFGGGGGSPHGDKKFLYVKIINFEKVD